VIRSFVTSELNDLRHLLRKGTAIGRTKLLKHPSAITMAVRHHAAGMSAPSASALAPQKPPSDQRSCTPVLRPSHVVQTAQKTDTHITHLASAVLRIPYMKKPTNCRVEEKVKYDPQRQIKKAARVMKTPTTKPANYSCPWKPHVHREIGKSKEDNRRAY
jgi:hypothetical protein